MFECVQFGKDQIQHRHRAIFYSCKKMRSGWKGYPNLGLAFNALLAQYDPLLVENGLLKCNSGLKKSRCSFLVPRGKIARIFEKINVEKSEANLKVKTL